MRAKAKQFYRFPVTVCTTLLLSSLAGCAGISALSAAGSMLDIAGIGKPKTTPYEIKVELDAAKNLNLSGSQPIALVTKIYYLKNATTFMQSSMDNLLDPVQEKALLGSDLLNVREMTLRPGQHYENVEKVPREAVAIGVVAMFHSPAPRRWRYAFDVKSVEETGIRMGVNACSMSALIGKPLPTPGLAEVATARPVAVTCVQK